MDVTSYLLGKNAGGGSEINNQNKNVTITTNGSSTVSADAGYTGLGTVGITTNVQPNLETLTETITENGTTTYTPSQNKDGFSSVSITTNVSGGGTTVSPDFVTFRGYDGTSLDVSWLRTENITEMSSMFRDCSSLQQLDLSKFVLSNGVRHDNMFRNTKKLAIIDISSFDTNKINYYANTFYDCGVQCLQFDGAYADGIPYIYVKDETAQNWVLTTNNGRPSTWTTDNVIIKQ